MTEVRISLHDFTALIVLALVLGVAIGLGLGAWFEIRRHGHL